MFVFAPIRWALRLIAVILIALVIYLIVCGVQVYTAASSASATVSPPSSAAIVSFVAEQTSPAPTGALLVRLHEVRRLYIDKVAPEVILVAPSTGASGPAALDWLAAHGVARAVLSIEPARTLAAGLGALSHRLGSGARVTLVTVAIDDELSRTAARSAGLTGVVVAVPGSLASWSNEVEPTFAQASALALGRVLGYSRVPWSGG